VTWSVPALARDTTLELVVTATVDAQQNDGEIVNSVSLVNPAGYSPPIIDDACATDADSSCARTTVPPTVSALAHAGIDLPVAALIAAALALLAGAVLLVVRSRKSERA
jgi:hypothetical protein